MRKRRGMWLRRFKCTECGRRYELPKSKPSKAGHIKDFDCVCGNNKLEMTEQSYVKVR